MPAQIERYVADFQDWNQDALRSTCPSLLHRTSGDEFAVTSGELDALGAGGSFAAPAQLGPPGAVSVGEAFGPAGPTLLPLHGVSLMDTSDSSSSMGAMNRTQPFLCAPSVRWRRILEKSPATAEGDGGEVSPRAVGLRLSSETGAPPSESNSDPPALPTLLRYNL